MNKDAKREPIREVVWTMERWVDAIQMTNLDMQKFVQAWEQLEKAASEFDWEYYWNTGKLAKKKEDK